MEIIPSNSVACLATLRKKRNHAESCTGSMYERHVGKGVTRRHGKNQKGVELRWCVRALLNCSPSLFGYTFLGNAKKVFLTEERSG